MSTFSTCTAFTRPSSPTDGDVLFETDTKNIILWDGTAWRKYNNDGTAAPPLTNTYSVDFDGTDDELTIPQGTFNLGSGLFTFSLWFNADSLNNLNVLFRINSSTTVSCSSFIRSNGEIWLSNWSFGQLVSTGNTINTGAWNHLAYVKSTTGSSGTVTIYYNGSSIASGPVPSGSNFGSESGTSAIGRSYAATHYPFNGKIDEFAFWDSALSAPDITDIYNRGVPTSLTSYSPVGWWRMGDNDGGTGTTVTDQGSGGNNGTLTNGPTFSTSVPS